MFENDYVWLLKTLANSSANINQLYGLRTRIPEMILLNSGEPKLWFYQDKDQIKARSDNLLKFNVIKEFFANPETINDPQSPSNEYMFGLQNNNQTISDFNKPLFCVNIEIPSKEIKVIKKITKGTAHQMFSNFQDNAESVKQWTKIFSYIPNKSANLFNVSLSKGFKDEQFKLKIVKKDYSLMEIKAEELSKPETRTNKRMLFPRNDKMVSDNNFASVASGANAVLEKAIKGIARFLESKTKLLLGEINLEVLVDSNYTCWIIGSKGINFYNTDGHLEKDTEKEGLVFPKHALKHFFSCPGTYCRFSGETNYHQEGDEAVNLYKKNLKHQTYEIPFKSVILDVIEKCKQIDRLKVSFPELSLKHILQFVEANPFQLRKYYSIGELLQSYLFRGYRVSNLYGNIKVCYNCHFIYGKIDGYRIQKVTKPENLEFNKEQAQAIIDKYFEDNALISSRNERPKKEVFSAAFYEKLEAFDKDILYLLGLEKKVETLEDFFEMTSAKLRNLSPLPERRSEVSVKSRASVTPSVRFPTINKEIIQDPRNIVSRERLRMPAGRQAEVIGCKHYLGHAKYLKDTGAGYALSKSSIHLNRLHDKLQKFRVNTDYGGDNVVEDSSTKDGTDYHSRIYTEDSKMQLNASQEEPRQLFHQRIKGLYAERQSENNNNSLFDVAVQKVHFLSDKEKDDLFERERKEKEKETQQKSFYSQNNLLAQSVLKNPLLATKSASSKNLLDQNFLIRVEENTKIRR